jgi:hypothetical protein
MPGPPARAASHWNPRNPPPRSPTKTAAQEREFRAQSRAPSRRPPSAGFGCRTLAFPRVRVLTVPPTFPEAPVKASSPHNLFVSNAFAFVRMITNKLTNKLYVSVIFSTVFAVTHLRSFPPPLSAFLVTSVVKSRRLFGRVQRKADEVPIMSPRINTYESLTKQTTLTTFRMNTYEKPMGRGAMVTRAARKAQTLRKVRELAAAQKACVNGTR